MTDRFDLAALDALLGSKDFITALDRNASTGCVRSAALTRDSFDNGTRVRVTASYALGFPRRGRRFYNLLTLDLQIHDGAAIVLCARRLGRLLPTASLTEALITLAQPLANAILPNRKQLAPFLPPALLDALESDLSAADFPDEGVDREERLPESLWDQPSVLHNGQIDSLALAVTLNLAVGERAQMADVDPDTGDSRVLYLEIAATPVGGKTLTFELHRQAPGYERRLFNVLSLALGPSGTDGLCPIENFTCDSGAGLDDLPRLLPILARIIAVLQERKRPEDALVLPFLSRSAQILWTQALLEGVAS